MTATGTKTTIEGRSLRFKFNDGPMKGQAFDHTFDKNGTVTFRGADATADDKGTKAKYGPALLSDDVTVVVRRQDKIYVSPRQSTRSACDDCCLVP